MTSKLGWQTIAIHILPNIWGNKSNQAMKLGQLIGDNKKNIFLQNLSGKWGRESSSRPFLFFRYAEVKASGLQLSLIYFDNPQLWI